MTPINPTPGSNFSSGPSPKPNSPAWQLWAMRIVCIAIGLYLIFGVALPGYRARQAQLNGPSPQASAPAH